MNEIQGGKAMALGRRLESFHEARRDMQSYVADQLPDEMNVPAFPLGGHKKPTGKPSNLRCIEGRQAVNKTPCVRNGKERQKRRRERVRILVVVVVMRIQV